MDSLTTDTVSTHYSYDIHGNVQSLWQQVPGLGQKRTDYVYDLVSGNVHYVFYQRDSADQFLQQYSYDADNRLTEVYTSSDGYLWNQEAQYLYYPHGPLARVELGERSVQGLDYYYTLQGWLKGVNGTKGNNDPAQDGITNRTAKDAFAFQLGYYEGDYQGIGVNPSNNQLWNRLNEQYPGTGPGQAAYKGLHNGNIAWMQTDLPGLKAQGITAQQAMLYQYDQLNRLVQAQSLRNFSETTGFAARSSSPEAFDTKYAYDPNGNLLTLQRNNEQGNLMDDFSYTYTAGTNRLANLNEALPADTTFFDTKIYNSGVLKPDGKVYREIIVENNVTSEPGQSPELRANEVITLKQNFHAKAGSGFHAKWVQEPNYEITDDNADFEYDEIGNLIWDSSADTRISWTPYGKVRQVKKGEEITVTYRYDGAGNRVEKKVIASDSSYVTRYIRDASGNVLAIYQNDSLLEQPIYGSSRLGMYKGGTQKGYEMLGNRRYELGNHLGNVLTVITDNIHMDADSTWATVESTQDYFSFGLEMNGRGFNASAMDYGFNGKMKDNSFGSTNYDYGFRIYSPKIGKFLSVDPLTKSYPMLTP